MTNRFLFAVEDGWALKARFVVRAAPDSIEDVV
jgi:hypothetical protein